MSSPRRFEKKHGNREEFWTIRREGFLLFTANGRIGEESNNFERAENFFLKINDSRDFIDPEIREDQAKRDAETKMDQMIQSKLKKGFLEVDKPSKPSDQLDFRSVRLVSLEGGHSLSIIREEYQKVIDWLLGLKLLNRYLNLPNLKKWEHRALRRLGLEELDPEDQDMLSAFTATILKISQGDRSKSISADEVPAKKMLEPYRIVNTDECTLMYNKINQDFIKHPSHRRTERNRFFDFLTLAKDNGGFEIHLAKMVFTTKKKTRLTEEDGVFTIPYMIFDKDLWESFIAMLVEINLLETAPEEQSDYLYNDPIDADEDYSPFHALLQDYAAKAIKLQSAREDVLLSEKLNAQWRQIHLITDEDRQIEEFPLPVPEDPEYPLFVTFMREWSKKTLKIRSAGSSSGAIPEYKLKDCNRWILNKNECTALLSGIAEAGVACSDELIKILELGVSRDGLITIHPDLEYDLYDYLNDTEDSEEDSDMDSE